MSPTERSRRLAECSLADGHTRSIYERAVCLLLKNGSTFPPSEEVLKILSGLFSGDPGVFNDLEDSYVFADLMSRAGTGLFCLYTLCLAKERM